jgi:hypothetical protein
MTQGKDENLASTTAQTERNHLDREPPTSRRLPLAWVPLALAVELPPALPAQK